MWKVVTLMDTGYAVGTPSQSSGPLPAEMSQFCTMPAGERKKCAAAICREVHGTNGDTIDLGKKLSAPKDIMLEELSLLSNRGSRLFKMRGRRSDKYTFESIQNEANTQLNNDILVANAHTVEIKVDAPDHEGSAGDAENSKSEAEKSEQWLDWTQDQSFPEYKSFNRVATPYGGFDKAPRGITFKLPEIDLSLLRYPELQEPGVKRPTFNRTAQGWITEGTHLILPTITLEPVEVPESEDL
ncbi:unnamed protein product [Pleuronectes platessa]|uniref:Myozenin 2 n=1 Tax=Pleuronectes platessa TaxID=8262 RepID=A0A9N7ULG8_PLEPL|nr:unnamed protein product [Pleuronectes platessa]